jgi:hypothetical protein
VDGRDRVKAWLTKRSLGGLEESYSASRNLGSLPDLFIML